MGFLGVVRIDISGVLVGRGWEGFIILLVGYCKFRRVFILGVRVGSGFFISFVFFSRGFCGRSWIGSFVLWLYFVSMCSLFVFNYWVSFEVLASF